MVHSSRAKTLWHLTHIPDEQRAVRSERDLSGIPLLGSGDYETSRNSSQDFFILGSGSSTLSLNSRAWGAIREGTSIGLNSWAFHPFVPDVLALEDIHTEELIPQRRAIIKGLHLLASSRKVQTVLKFRASNTIPSSLRLEIPSALRSRSRLYGRFQIPPASNSHQTRGAIRAGLALDRMGSIPQSLLIDHGASLIRMIHFALRSGANRIILVGIDLINSEYFFEADPSFLSRIGELPFLMSGPDKRHGTASSRSGSGSIIDFIQQLGKVLWAERGIELLALNPNYHLRNFIPLVSF